MRRMEELVRMGTEWYGLERRAPDREQQMTGAEELTAEERVFASMLADAVLEYARRNLKQLRRAKRRHEPMPLPLPAEPAPSGCVWIGDRVILPGDRAENAN